MTPLLQFVRTCFQYNDRQPVLCDVDFTLSEGTCSVLIGANGAGKTTLLRLASGTLAANSGKVLLEGRPVGDIPHRQRSRLVALVPQRLDVPFDFSVQQIVEQGRTPYLGLLSGPAREDRLAVDRALELTDTARLRRRIFNELSGESVSGSRSLLAWRSRRSFCCWTSRRRTSILAGRRNSSTCCTRCGAKALRCSHRSTIFI